MFTMLVPYSVYAILLNVLIRRRQWLVGNGQMLVGFLQVYRNGKQPKSRRSEEDEEISAYGLASSTLVLLGTGVCNTVCSARSERRLRVLHEATKVVAAHLQDYKLKRHVVKTIALVSWKCVSLL